MYIIISTTDDKHIGRRFTFNEELKTIKIDDVEYNYDYLLNENDIVRFVNPHYTIIGKLIN